MYICIADNNSGGDICLYKDKILYFDGWVGVWYEAIQVPLPFRRWGFPLVQWPQHKQLLSFLFF